MTFRDDTAEMLIAAMELGNPALYTPVAGSAKTINVMESRADIETGFGGSRIKSNSGVFEVLVSDIAQPARGDTLTVTGLHGVTKAYVVKSFRYLDDQQLIWFLDCSPV